MNNLNVKTGDKVQVISGHDKGKQGKVVTVSAKENKVIVEGVNMVTKHVKPQGNQPGGRVQAEGALYASKVMLVCPKCNKTTRVAHKIEDGKKIRVCKHCGAELKY
jgi:large subunit ribosomal protein L24